ncbi:tagatose-6-phosphate kinase [Lentibacillus kapialis]|uniref:Tagatose-6-phosphate kinase n=1 Tax=Lentibacillus kapialis TaxID=340214 RepID=A0A917PZR8_9BACI|nr:1-phosphofructokinase [Lentibacillus kapialis]GGK03735.1 tagatose-6-phosphate kinase [Lentibacillus kapialis]
MIYTCTMNAAIDMYVEVDEMKPNAVNRTNDEDYQANGKGINVSIMLKKLGIESTALGFIAGFTGAYIEDFLSESGIQSDFVYADGTTRINVFINAESEYKIVNQGPHIKVSEQEALLNGIKAIPGGSTLVVSGSLPRGVPESVIVEIAEVCKMNNVKLVLDTSVSSVWDTLTYEPYLLKPNEEELANLYHQTRKLTEQEIIKYGKDLLKRGAQHVIVSRGKEGSIYVSKERLLKATSPQGTVVNTACSGDTMLAAFMAKKQQHESLENALKYASAVGASTAFSRGLSNLKDIAALQKEVNVYQMKEEIT